MRATWQLSERGHTITGRVVSRLPIVRATLSRPYWRSISPCCCSLARAYSRTRQSFSSTLASTPCHTSKGSKARALYPSGVHADRTDEENACALRTQQRREASSNRTACQLLDAHKRNLYHSTPRWRSCASHTHVAPPGPSSERPVRSARVLTHVLIRSREKFRAAPRCAAARRRDASAEHRDVVQRRRRERCTESLGIVRHSTSRDEF
jgi:hypothetical protein